MDLKLKTNFNLKLSKVTTLEEIVGQLQPFHDKYFYVEDGTLLKSYTDKHDFPHVVKFESRKDRNGITEFYFREKKEQGLFCVFGLEAAKVLDNSLKIILPPKAIQDSDSDESYYAGESDIEEPTDKLINKPTDKIENELSDKIVINTSVDLSYPEEKKIE
jgi:hypothetical protein